MNKHYIHIAGWSIIVLILMTMLAFPFGNDQAIFEVGGALISQKGWIPFRDYLDLKQPLIFYIYSISTFLFGRHLWSVRALDILQLVVAVWLFYRVLTIFFKDKDKALLSVFLYTVLYVGGGFWVTAQTETFVLLPSLLIVLSLEKLKQRASIWWVIAISLLILGICLIKLTLGFIAIPALYYCYKEAGVARNRVLTQFAVVLTVCIGGTYLLMAAMGMLENFNLVLKWFSDYKSNYSALGMSQLKELFYKLFPAQVVATITPSFIVLLLLGIVRTFDRARNKKPLLEHRATIFFLGSAIVGLISILAEGKAYSYHFMRIMWCIVPFITIGIWSLKEYYAIERIQTLWIKRYYVHFFVIICTLGLFIFWSPIPKLFDQSFGWTKAALQKEGAVEQKLLSYQYDITEVKQLALKYAPLISDTSTLFLWGNTAQVYYEFKTLPTTLCIVNAQLISDWTPFQWKSTMLAQLKKAPPLLFLCETGDARASVSGSADDSYAALQKFSSLNEFLSGSYKLLDSTSHFRVYKNIQK